MRLARGKIVRQAGERLRSEKGVSLPLVLFLFLICAMASAIVLAAATASTGRFAQLTESDRMYYSVSSAASFMKDYIEKQPEVIVEQEFDSSTNTYSVYVVRDGSKVLVDESFQPTFMEKLALCTAFGYESNGFAKCLNEWDAASGWWDDYFPYGDINVYADSNIAVAGSGVDEQLKATMQARIDESGDLLIEMRSREAENLAGMTVVLTPGFETSTRVSGNIATETISVNWSVSEVTKNKAGA